MQARLIKVGRKVGLELTGAYDARDELEARGYEYEAGSAALENAGAYPDDYDSIHATWRSPWYEDEMALWGEYAWVREHLRPEATGNLAKAEAVWDEQIAPHLTD